MITDPEIEFILRNLPHEGDSIDYKAAEKLDEPGESDRRKPKKNRKPNKEQIKHFVIATLNSINAFGTPKYLIFGVEENKRTKELTIEGLKGRTFPDDNEWQNLFSNIGPIPPAVQTGTLKFHGLTFGYFKIHGENYNGPYYDKTSAIPEGTQPTQNKGIEYIRHGSNCDRLEESAEREELVRLFQAQKASLKRSRDAVIAASVGAICGNHQGDRKLIQIFGGCSFDTYLKRCVELDLNLLRWEPKNTPYGTDVYTVSNHAQRLKAFMPEDAAFAEKIISTVLSDEGLSSYSAELLRGVVRTAVILSDAGYSHSIQRVLRPLLMKGVLERGPSEKHLSELACAAPDLFLQWASAQTKTDCSTAQRTRLISVLQTIAWFPEYFEQAVALLTDLKAEKTLYHILHFASVHTAADMEMKRIAIQAIMTQNESLAFTVLKYIYTSAMYSTSIYSAGEASVPERYQHLQNGEHSVSLYYFNQYYSFLLQLAGNDATRYMVLLPPQFPPFPFTDLEQLAENLFRISPENLSAELRESLWVRLCYLPLVYTDNFPVEKGLQKKLNDAGTRLAPTHRYAVERLSFRKDCVRLWEKTDSQKYLDAQEFLRSRESFLQKRTETIRGILDRDGINGLIAFILSLTESPYDISQLPDAIDQLCLNEEDEKTLLDGLQQSEKLQDTLFSCCELIFYRRGLRWLQKMDERLTNVCWRGIIYAALRTDCKATEYIREHHGDAFQAFLQEAKPDRLYQFLPDSFDWLKDMGLMEKAYAVLDCARCFRIDFRTFPLDWLRDRMMEATAESHPPVDVFAEILRTMYADLTDEVAEEAECLALRLYGNDILDCAEDVFRTGRLIQRLTWDPESFVKCVQDAKHLKQPFCKLLYWISVSSARIEEWLLLMERFSSENPDRAPEDFICSMGFVSFSSLSKDQNGDYQLEDTVARRLECSEAMRNGFFLRAYYPTGNRIVGDFKSDQQSLADAHCFLALAQTQEQRGRLQLASALRKCSGKLLNAVTTF